MVARITFPGSVQKALNYNEQKVQKGTAVCIGGNGFLLPVKELNFYNKLAIYERRNAVNELAKSKALHVSLNFSPEEHLSTEKLNGIAHDYMQRIGFGDQPYFVYHHTDAGHPHIHVLASTIRADGKRIDTHNIGRNQSEFARRFVEVKYDLVQAGKSTGSKSKKIVPFAAEKVVYGRSETQRGIANVVGGVVCTYNITSFHELNAALKQFNIYADRGKEDSFVYWKKGLLYRVLDANGNTIGVPIKASSLPGNPGLVNLERKFSDNAKSREQFRLKLKDTIDKELNNKPGTIGELSNLLKSQGVASVNRVNNDGRMYGITFVDTVNRSVFNGSEIGKMYSVAGLIKQLNDGQPDKSGTLFANDGQQTLKAEGKGFVEFNGVSPVSGLMTPVEDFNLTPYHLKKKKKRKIRR